MKKNIFAKIVAVIALFAIVMSVVWTWILLIYESLNPSSIPKKQEINQDELQDILKKYSSWNTLSWVITNSWNINIKNSSWSLINTWITK